MSESNETEEGLAILLADALVQDTLDADLLLRYASDPGALASAERERVDRYLAASPAHRQQLRSLLRFEEKRSQLAEGDRSGSSGSAGDATVTAIDSHSRWRYRAPLIAAALAASLLAALLYGVQGGFGIGGRPDAQLVVEEVPAIESPRPGIPVRPFPEPAPKPSVEEQQTQLAHEENSAESPGPASGMEEPSVPGPRPAFVVLETAPTPAPQVKDVPPLAPRAVPEETVSHEPILLAMNFSGPLVYARPDDAIELARLGGLRNVGPGLPGLQALVPGHVVQTLNASPSFYWYLSEDTDQAIEFVLADRVSIDPLLTRKIESPLAAGIHALHLTDRDVVLEPGKEYRWFVSLSSGDGIASEDVVTRGAVLRIEPAAELVDTLENAPVGERGRIYAEHGLWYDALVFISAGIDRNPRDARLRELRAGLLEAGGLSQAADHDRRAAAQATP